MAAGIMLSGCSPNSQIKEKKQENTRAKIKKDTKFTEIKKDAKKNNLNFNNHFTVVAKKPYNDSSYLIPKTFDKLIDFGAETGETNIAISGVVKNWHPYFESKGGAVTLLEVYVEKSYPTDKDDLSGKTIYVVHQGGSVKEGDLLAAKRVEKKKFDTAEKPQKDKIVFSENSEDPIPEIGSNVVLAISKVKEKYLDDSRKLEYKKYGLDNVWSIMGAQHTEWIFDKTTKKYKYISKSVDENANNYLEQVNKIFLK